MEISISYKRRYSRRAGDSSGCKSRGGLLDWAPSLDWLGGPEHIVVVGRGGVVDRVTVAIIEHVAIAREVESPWIGIEGETAVLAILHHGDCLAIEGHQALAYFSVHSLAVAMAWFWSSFHCWATSLASGSSGLGAPSKA